MQNKSKTWKENTQCKEDYLYISHGPAIENLQVETRKLNKFLPNISLGNINKLKELN